MKKAVVVGGTGAIGREVVGILLTSGQWSHVVTVGRRAVEVPAAYPPSAFKGTLEQVVVNMDNLEVEGAAAFKGAHAVFCTLGTTRKAAGSAEEFIKVDYGYVAKTAVAAKTAGVPHFALVTSMNASSNVWASTLSAFHGLLYIRTKGQAEEAVLAQGFQHAIVYRPGMLARGDMARAGEKWFGPWFTSINVADVARCMVHDAERPDADKLPPFSIFSMPALLAAAKEQQQAAAAAAAPPSTTAAPAVAAPPSTAVAPEQQMSDLRVT